MQDVPAIARLARARGILTLIDNTWAAGLLFKPLAHGVDLSVQALTKYVGGHSDVFMGSAATNDRRRSAQRAGARRSSTSAGRSRRDDAYQMLRGLRTLPTRLARHGAARLLVAAWLREQPRGRARCCTRPCPARRATTLWKRDFTGAAGALQRRAAARAPAARSTRCSTR